MNPLGSNRGVTAGQCGINGSAAWASALAATQLSVPMRVVTYSIATSRRGGSAARVGFGRFKKIRSDALAGFRIHALLDVILTAASPQFKMASAALPLEFRSDPRTVFSRLERTCSAILAGSAAIDQSLEHGSAAQVGTSGYAAYEFFGAYLNVTQRHCRMPYHTPPLTLVESIIAQPLASSLFAGMASESKRRRVASSTAPELQRLLHTGSISTSGLAKLLSELREADLGATRRQLRDANGSLFRSLRHTEEMPLTGGGTFEWNFVNPNRMLAEMLSRSTELNSLYAAAVRRTPPTLRQPWSLVIGFDEFMPGLTANANQLCIRTQRLCRVTTVSGSAVDRRSPQGCDLFAHRK